MVAMLMWLLACGGGDGTDTDVTDTSETGDTGPAPECNTDNESCAPHTCGGEGSNMLPGADCVSCHSRNSGEDEAPVWSVAGTAFADLYGGEPLSGATVRITDADGVVTELTTNRVGNFYTSAHVAKPYSAEIEVNGQIQSMSASQDEGGCNSCHACAGAAGGKLRGP
jgi:hypothetical protein